MVRKPATALLFKTDPDLPAPAANGVYVGTSGWSYSSWKPEFYPAGVSSKTFLNYYATQLNTVEVNYTFQRIPTEAMVQGWLSAVPRDFRFSFKAPQRITHMQRLRNSGDALAELIVALRPVSKSKQMGSLLFQLPPNFKIDVPRLNDFLAEATKAKLKMAFEFRHDSWFIDEVFNLLRRHKVALCVAESDELQTPDEATAPFYCYRFRKSDYSRAELKAITLRLHQRSATGEVFAYFKHEEAPTGAFRAVEVLNKLRARP